MVRGFRFGAQGARFGAQGGQLAASEPQPPSDVRVEGVKYGAQGTRFGVRPHGGLYTPTVDSVDDIITRADGWTLIIEREGGERYVASPDETPTHDLITLSFAFETNNLSDWRVEVPPDPALYEFSFADVVIGHGDWGRFFHGQLLPVSGDSGGAVELGGFGPLWWATHGHIETTYPGGMAWWEAINDAWQAVADVSDGRVRGYALRPPADKETHIPDGGDGEGASFSGTPLAVLKEMHAAAGMVFSFDHADPAAVGVSFLPGEERRRSDWRTIDYSVDVVPTGYHNQVTVVGAKATDAYPHARWQGTATVSDMELRTVTDGRIIDYYHEEFDLASPSACEMRAHQLLGDFRAEFSVTGSVEATPTRVQPGFIYRVEEFEKAAPSPFHPVELPLQSVEHSFARGEAKTSLKFESPEGVVGAIRERIQPDGVDDEIGAPAPIFPTPASIDAWGDAWWGAGQWGGDE